MSRRIARELAVQTLFQTEFSDVTIEDALKVSEEELDKVSDNSSEYALTLSKGVLHNKEEIDKYISNYAKDWDIKRIALVDLNILRIAIFEMYFSDQNIDESVSINEAVEVAKKYAGDESPKFINGILGTLVRTLNVEKK